MFDCVLNAPSVLVLCRFRDVARTPLNSKMKTVINTVKIIIITVKVVKVTLMQI